MWRNALSALLLCLSLGAHAIDLPQGFAGEWKDTLSSDSGTLLILIKENRNGVLRGTITIGGSNYCKKPVSFVGTHTDGVVRVTSDEIFPCGYAGTLTGVVRRESSTRYVGSFSYVLLKTWAHGTFQLSPAEFRDVEKFPPKE